VKGPAPLPTHPEAEGLACLRAYYYHALKEDLGFSGGKANTSAVG